MVSDSIANALIPMAASNSKDFPKKKRANRLAKLEQCKLEWLSKGKNACVVWDQTRATILRSD